MEASKPDFEIIRLKAWRKWSGYSPLDHPDAYKFFSVFKEIYDDTIEPLQSELSCLRQRLLESETRAEVSENLRKELREENEELRKQLTEKEPDNKADN